MTHDEAATDGTLAGRVATLEAGLRTLQANYEAIAARIAGMNLEVPVVAPKPPGPAPDETPDQIRDRMLARAKGCFDYSGGYRGDPKLLEAFHHGIQTVINALSDPGSLQSRVLEAIGAPPTRTEEEARREPKRGEARVCWSW